MGYYHPMRQLTGEVGDPGFGRFLRRATRVPRSIRRFQPGRAALRGIRAAAPYAQFLPGPVGGAFRLARTFGVAGDPGFFDILKGAAGAIGRFVSKPGAVSAAASQLEQRAAAFLGSPTGRAVAGGVATGVAGAAVGAFLGRGRGGAPARVGGRRVDVTNVRALKRSMRRLEGFEKLAKQVVSFTHPTRGGEKVVRFKRSKGRRR